MSHSPPLVDSSQSTKVLNPVSCICLFKIMHLIIYAGLVRVPYAHGLSRASCPPSKGIAKAIISPLGGYQRLNLSLLLPLRGKSFVEALSAFKSGYQMRVTLSVADKR